MPINVASIASITVESLNKVPGVEAKGFFVNRHKYHYPSKNSFYFEGISRKRRPHRWLKQEIERFFLFKKLYNWADIIHWVYDDAGLKNREKKLIRKLYKPSVIEWVGSDIRNPEKLFAVNPYYNKAFKNGYEYAHYESESQSFSNQQKFFEYGSVPLVNPEMDIYLEKRLFPKRYYIAHKLFLDEFIPQYPDVTNQRPLILHSPTAQFAKGSNFILPIIEELKKEYDFDFRLLQNMPREEVLSLMRQCDIFIDQVIIGMHGLASSEAMAFGKPVLCYLMPEIFKNGFSGNCPIVNASVDTLRAELINLITDPQLRYKTGVASRQYAEENFDAVENAKGLVSIYKEVIKDYKK
jgi:ABC-type cobalt transport system substrate-binding protein